MDYYERFRDQYNRSKANQQLGPDTYRGFPFAVAGDDDKTLEKQAADRLMEYYQRFRDQYNSSKGNEEMGPDTFRGFPFEVTDDYDKTLAK